MCHSFTACCCCCWASQAYLGRVITRFVLSAPSWERNAVISPTFSPSGNHQLFSVPFALIKHLPVETVTGQPQKKKKKKKRLGKSVSASQIPVGFHMRTELFWMHRQGVCGDGRRNLGAWFNDVHTLYPCVSGLDLIPLGLHSAPCMIPRKGSAELLLLNPGTFLPWANSYLLEILRPKNWTLTPPRNSGKFYSSLIETKSDFFPSRIFFCFIMEKGFPIFLSKRFFLAPATLLI